MKELNFTLKDIEIFKEFSEFLDKNNINYTIIGGRVKPYEAGYTGFDGCTIFMESIDIQKFNLNSLFKDLFDEDR